MSAVIRVIQAEIDRLEARYTRLDKLVFENHYSRMLEITQEIKDLPGPDVKKLGGQGLIDFCDKYDALIKERKSLHKKAQIQQDKTGQWYDEMVTIQDELRQLNQAKKREAQSI